MARLFNHGNLPAPGQHPPRLRKASLLFVTVATLMAALTLRAENQTSLTPPDYTVTTWRVDDGLPQSTITSITQTPDGYLWLGTFGGLVRFDGVRFTVFDSANTPELKSGRIVKIRTDHLGELWVLSEYGDTARYSNGRFKAFTSPDGVPTGGFTAVCEDHAGRIWAAGLAAAGVFLLKGERFVHVLSTYENFDGSALPLGSMFGFFADTEGNLWGGEAFNLIQVYPSDPRRIRVEIGGDVLQVMALGPSRDGGLWIVTPRGAQKRAGGKWVKEMLASERIATASSILEDREGQIWIGTWDQGLFRLGPNGEFGHYPMIEGPAPVAVRSLFEDAEGDIWMGVQGAGLRRLKRPAFKTFNTASGLAGNVVRSVSQDNSGDIWVASDGGLDRLSPGSQPVAHRVDFPIGHSWCVLGGRQGGVWVGTFGRGWYHGWPGAFVTGTDHPLWSIADCTVLFEGSHGDIWAGVQDNLVPTFGVRSPLSSPFIHSEVNSSSTALRGMAEDRAGQLFAATGGDGLWHTVGTNWVRFPSKDGLPGDRIWALFMDSEGILWLGDVLHGLVCLRDGRFYKYDSVALGLPRSVASILEDDLDNLWLGSNQGVFRVSRRDLKAGAGHSSTTVRVTRFTQSDGLETVECASGRQPIAWKARDGRLWFATAKGVSVVDPTRLPFNPIPPPVVLEKLRVEGPLVREWNLAEEVARGPQGTTALIKLDPGVERVEIQYTALSFVAPERMSFKYRLDGFDRDWVEAGSARLAAYTRLPPGSYQFKVVASNNDGVWNHAGALLTLVVLPHFWETWWFIILTFLSLAGGTAAWVRQIMLGRLRRSLERLEHQHALEKERLRISRDMHDALGADLAQIALVTELAASETGQTAMVADKMRKAAALAREVSKSVDAMVWAVNPTKDSLDQFVAYVCQYAEELLETAGIRFRWEAPASLPSVPLSAELRHNLFLAMKEALNNLVKYSAATTAQVRVSFEPGSLRLEVADDGRGFTPATVVPSGGGNGLKNMRQRLERCGGRAVIESRPGGGTRIEFIVPLNTEASAA